MENLFFTFFNPDFFVAMVTFFVGSFAIGLYIKQKRDHKIGAASLILQEIRYAEHTIRNARTQAKGNFSLSDKLLPTNSWHKNINLFVKDLKESQIDLISRFYSQAQYLDVVIRSISDKRCKKDPVVELQQFQPQIQQQTSQQQAPIMSPAPPQIFPLEISESPANKILKEVTDKIELIYNTPAIEKLIQISEKKWYQLF